MDGMMAEFVRGVELGKVQEFGGMSVIPIFSAGDSHDYLTLKEAMKANSSPSPNWTRRVWYRSSR
ncbi:MAG: hypothetical protein Q8M92_04705 [Candidatus Subteraquimicrobiales bacterium]|nr:hypothetical protein [Candidatus Subteraquimicrobiales bacterium]